MSDEGCSKNTIKAYRADLSGFFGFAGNHSSDDFNRLAAQYLTNVRTQRAPKTVLRYLSTLRVFGEWHGVEEPLKGYRKPTPARPRPHPLPEGVRGVLLMLDEAKNQDERDLVALLGLVGLRVSEATESRIEDVDPLDKVMRVRGKGDKEREVPLTDRVLDILGPRLLEQESEDRRLVRMHERYARKVVTRLAEQALLARAVSSHDLRATFATAAYNRSGDLRAVQELLGHSDSRTTEVYTGVTMDAMREAGDIAE